MKTLFTLILLFSASFAIAQTTIKGKVLAKSGEPIPEVIVFIENTYHGASSNGEGNFSFSTSESGSKVLLASFIGYKSWKKEIKFAYKTSI